MSKGKVYKDESWLQEHYCEQELSTRECGKLARCSANTILYWLRKHSIQRRTKREATEMAWAKGDHTELSKKLKAAHARGCYDNIQRERTPFRDRDWLQEHYCEQRLSLQECGELAGCHFSTISYQLEKYGLPRRAGSDAAGIAWEQGKHNSEETRQKKSENMKARHARGVFADKYTEDVLQKMSEATKAAWARGAHADKFTEDVRQRQSAGVKAAHMRGCYDGVFQSPTSIEIAISKALDELGIMHVQQYRPEGCGYIYDEYLLAQGILLEVNGDYWHTKEGAPERDAQKENWAREYGFTPITIWGSEIKEHGALAMVQERVR